MKNKRMVRIVIALLLVAGGVIIFVNAQDDETPDPSATDTVQSDYRIDGIVQVQTDDLTQSVTGAGVLEPARSVVLSFQTVAPVVEIVVSEGQQVTGGEVLARVDGSDFGESIDDALLQLALEELAFQNLLDPATAEDIAVAEAAVEAARLAMGTGVALTGAGSLAAEIDAINAELQSNLLWQSQLNRDSNPPNLDGAWIAVLRTEEGSAEREEALNDYYLFEAQAALTENNLEVLESQVAVAQDVATAEQQRPTTTGGSSSAQEQLVQAQLNLESLIGEPDDVDLSRAQIDLALAELDVAFVQVLAAQTELVAPFDGVVVAINMAPGEVPPTDAITLLDDSRFYITIPVDEIDVVQLQPGQPVNVTLPALPQASVTGEIADIAFNPQQINDVTTYDVSIELNASDEMLRAGLSASVEIITSNVMDATLVPSEFVLEIEQLGAEVVIVQAEDGSLEPRRVTIGMRAPGRVEIVDGVAAGETVVLLSQAEFQRLLRDLVQSGQLNPGGFR